MVYIFASIGFFLWSIRTILFWTGLWQIKEYRLDRLVTHLKETVQGRSVLLSPYLASNILILLLYGFVITNDKWTYAYQLLVVTYFGLLSLVFIREIITNSLKRPAITLKSLVICLLTLSVIVFGYIFNLADHYVWLVILGLTIPLLIALFVYGFSFPTELYKDFLVQKARKKLMNLKKIKVIGVSGSYGKSSTKEYVAHILAKKFSVVKSSFSNNTPIAIAQTILKEVNNNTDICVFEIGSYKKGEVDEICSMIFPVISITTALGEQHLSLYGNMKNIIETERELIACLPKNGLALFNANSLHMEKLYAEAKRKKVLYGTDTKTHSTSISILAQGIHSEKNGIAFSCQVGTEYMHFHTSLLGEHNVENILPAIYLAHYLGLTSEEIKKGVESLVPLSKTMRKFTSQEGVNFIDDSFNASPESVMAAATYMKLYNKKKIFVLHPLIELGKKAKQYHQAIGEELAQFDYLFLTNKNFLSDIRRGIQEKNGVCKAVVLSKDKIAEKISEIAKKGDVVLFEGKETSAILNKLL